MTTLPQVMSIVVALLTAGAGLADPVNLPNLKDSTPPPPECWDVLECLDTCGSDLRCWRENYFGMWFVLGLLCTHIASDFRYVAVGVRLPQQPCTSVASATVPPAVIP